MKSIESSSSASERLQQTQQSLGELPPPDRDARAHSEALIVQLVSAIETAGGRIAFDDYMRRTLYTPGLGYYSGGSRKFGAEGDFVTAPELSPLFSHCLARQCAQVLQDLHESEILEFGAGTGTMASEILLELERLQQLPKRYLILELSAELRSRQQQTLQQKAPHLLAQVVWLDTLPQEFNGVILANEVLDAMPVHRICHQQGQWQEQFVGWSGERFTWQLADTSPAIPAAMLDSLPPVPEGYCTELAVEARQWVSQLGKCLQQGLILLIDYGFPRHEFYHPQRSDGTLMCHYRHRAHGDPFVYPGLQDITAHVDFTAVAEAALEADLSVYGYTSQAMFLLGCGLTDMVEGIEEDAERIRLAQQVKTLTLPSEMGELFKVMALGSGLAETALMGFEIHDMRGKL